MMHGTPIKVHVEGSPGGCVWNVVLTRDDGEREVMETRADMFEAAMVARGIANDVEGVSLDPHFRFIVPGLTREPIAGPMPR